MGFLKRDKAPNELPDLAIGSSLQDNQNQRIRKETIDVDSQKPIYQKLPNQIIPEQPRVHMEHKQIAGEDYLEFSAVHGGESEEIKKKIDETIINPVDHKSFFDNILNDINGEIRDLGKLEDWYEKKFLPQDVVSNMRSYWEDNKADIIIKSFGSEYKQKINDRIKHLQELEADWREIYFKLIKKEEDMKKEEKMLKEILSEFVELCKRRGGNEEKKI
jgi:hypothetical protein